MSAAQTVEAAGAGSPLQGHSTLKGFRFEGGTVLDLNIGYWTMGELDRDGGNAVLLSHGASGNRDWALPFCRRGGAFDPVGRFIISIDLPGGGGSSRASTTHDFPARYSMRDLTNALAGLLDALGAKRNVVFSGVSVSTLVGLDLAALHPELFGAMALWNSAARCDGYAQAAIDAVAAILAIDGGPAGMRAAVESFYPTLTGRSRLAAMDAAGRAGKVEHIAQGWIARWRADEITARYLGTIGGDVPALHGGEAALAARIRCPILWLASSSDQLLPAHAIAAFAGQVPSGRVEVLQNDNGHQSTSSPPGSPGFQFYDGQTAAFMAKVSEKLAQSSSVSPRSAAPSTRTASGWPHRNL